MKIQVDLPNDLITNAISEKIRSDFGSIVPNIVKSIVDQIDKDLKIEIRNACIDNIKSIFGSHDFQAYVKNSFDLEVRDVKRGYKDLDRVHQAIAYDIAWAKRTSKTKPKTKAKKKK